MNLSLNELKRRKRRSFLFLKPSNSDEQEFDVPDDSAGNEYSDEKEIVQNAIQKLKPEFRSVIVLRLMDGYSTAETAEILNLPMGTVLSRLARGQKKLKELLSPLMGEINDG